MLRNIEDMATLLIGTSGYSYNEWVGPVYPAGTRREDFLSLYAQDFATVELNFSYYQMPKEAQLQKMLQEGGKALHYSIKAHQSLTHTIDYASWKDSAGEFCRAADVLFQADRLAAVLFQFPYSFHYEADQRRYLDAILRECSAFPLAVEFRNGQWYNSRTIEALRTRNISLVSLDIPETKGMPPMMDVSTSSFAYLRLHGRNGDAWWKSDAAGRYDYLYSERELEAIAQRVKMIASSADTVLVYFNNHRRGQAVLGAKRLAALLGGRGSGHVS